MRNELHKDGKVITCYEKGYMVDNVPVKELEIDQDNGIDKKDRVQRLIEYFIKDNT